MAKRRFQCRFYNRYSIRHFVRQFIGELMGKYGYKIKNYQAGSVYAVGCGVRTNYDYTDAMLTNSLFTDFIETHGLKVYKGVSTRDIICLEFNYGSRSYEEEKKRLNQTKEKIKHDEALAEEKRTEKLQFVDNLLLDAESNKDKFDKKSSDEIRTIFYRDGVTINYSNESIHYRRLGRTSGKAKKGSCMFVCDRLYKKAIDFLYMGLKLPEVDTPIVEIGAYSSLVMSTIVDHIRIDPQNIFIMQDFKSSFITSVTSIEVDEEKHCQAIEKHDYEISNELFDGQALIDLSIFPDWGNGYVLLRHHFTKMAAFAADIQKFFQDHYGKEYETAEIVDMFGVKHKVKDIKLITTNNAIKWLKLGVSYKYWCKKVRENGCLWGIVKTAHDSKLGDVQRMSYQMVNSLDESTIDEVLKPSLDYIHLLKTDTPTFIEHLRRNSTFSNDYEVLIALYEQNPDFERCDYFRSRRNCVISSYIWNLKNGRLIQNADNLTIVGSPYAMLLHTVGCDPLDDPTFYIEDGATQCYTNKFEDGEYLAEFRSPFNGRANLGYLKNHYHPYFDRYFRFGNLCIAVNMVHTDFQDRNNGSDQDSDSIYVTNQKDIVAHAKYCRREYLTIVNNIPKAKNHYDNSPESYAEVDNKLNASQRAIGESSNLAQIALSYSYSMPSKSIENNVCILSVLAQCAIDNAKRTFDIDIMDEIKRIKKELDVANNGYPKFWLVIRNGFDKDRINPRLRCPMNSVYNIKAEYEIAESSTLPIKDFFIPHKLDCSRNLSKRIEGLIEKYSLELFEYNRCIDEKNMSEYLLLRNDFDELIEDIRRSTISKKNVGLMSWLINRAFLISDSIIGNSEVIKTTLNKNRSLLLKTLYEVNPEALMSCFTKK